MLIIRLYWLIPPAKRKNCLFRVSCSKYVYNITLQYGLIKGLYALQYRYKSCRPGAKVFLNRHTGKLQMILPDNIVIEECHIAEHIVKANV